jgi:ATP-dependent Clp protease ATP-binding subunit ClpA
MPAKHCKACGTSASGLAEKGYSPEFGARPLERLIEQQIAQPLARQVLAGLGPESRTIRVIMHGDSVRILL